MIEIKGDELEGGGQILRTAAALSSVFKVPLRVFDIRARRPNPGMMAQHVMCVKALAQLTSAELSGVEKGSREITYSPKRLGQSRLQFHIGTAGSTMLVFQTIMPLLAFSQKSEIQISGGTHVAWSPNFHYVKNVFVPVLETMGCPVKHFELERYGWYPRGGGRVSIITLPVEKLKPLQLTGRGKLLSIAGISASSNLPEHVVERQASSAETFLKNAGYSARIKRESAQSSSIGSTVTLWAKYENALIGSSALGALGKKSEKVGGEAAAQLLKEMKSNACVDSHLADQLLVYMALADGRSEIFASELTTHTKTNIWVIEQFINRKFRIEERGDRTVRISIDGIGFSKSNLPYGI